MQVKPSTGFDIGQRRGFVQEQDQVRSLSQVRCRCASGHEVAGPQRESHPGNSGDEEAEGQARDDSVRGVIQVQFSDGIPSIVAALESP